MTADSGPPRSRAPRAAGRISTHYVGDACPDAHRNDVIGILAETITPSPRIRRLREGGRSKGRR